MPNPQVVEAILGLIKNLDKDEAERIAKVAAIRADIGPAPIRPNIGLDIAAAKDNGMLPPDNAIKISPVHKFTPVAPAVQDRFFRRGDKVWFHGKGRTIYGVVTKVNRKSVAVTAVWPIEVKNLRWRIAPSLLSKAAEANLNEEKMVAYREVGVPFPVRRRRWNARRHYNGYHRHYQETPPHLA